MTNIATDHPLTELHRQTLAALLDTILPESDDGTIPSARELDLIGYLQEKDDAFIPALREIADSFDEKFAGLPLAERYPVVKAFSEARAELFQGLLFHTYVCYYQDHRVLEGIGLAAGPPFPRGNDVEMGDLSLLDSVVQRTRTYRK